MDGRKLTLIGVPLSPHVRYSDLDIHQYLFNQLYLRGSTIRLDQRKREGVVRSDDFYRGQRDSFNRAMDRFRSRTVPDYLHYNTPNSDLPHTQDDLLEAERLLFTQERDIALHISGDASDDYNRGAVAFWHDYSIKFDH